MDDREARLFRIEQLKQRITRDKSHGSLFDECIDALGSETRIYSLEASQNIVTTMVNTFNFTRWGRLDWNGFAYNGNLIRINELMKLEFINTNEDYQIIWDEYSLPVVESSLVKIIENFDDVIAVGFDTWIINFELGIIIENHHEGEITIGVKKLF
ncbi:hypothetical protein D7Z26_27025 [Cohnella endophytica]|uniref:Uncharacterized protein n=1 Tax=Cohnella endophytica TaxID=2419778 RepID=A0A494X045_9BACL|nr:hypothetical protein [Cohnella endophytica]RKP44067.1 hypothetical protein D7Z26_27025 [Cohnella endophytica]